MVTFIRFNCANTPDRSGIIRPRTSKNRSPGRFFAFLFAYMQKLYIHIRQFSDARKAELINQFSAPKYVFTDDDFCKARNRMNTK